jgi:hypothetical protein
MLGSRGGPPSLSLSRAKQGTCLVFPFRCGSVKKQKKTRGKKTLLSSLNPTAAGPQREARRVRRGQALPLGLARPALAVALQPQLHLARHGGLLLLGGV